MKNFQVNLWEEHVRFVPQKRADLRKGGTLGWGVQPATLDEILRKWRNGGWNWLTTLLIQNPVHKLELIETTEGKIASNNLVKHDAEGVDVDLLVVIFFPVKLGSTITGCE